MVSSGGAPAFRDAGVALDGRLVHLRPARSDDAARFAEILADPTVHARWQAADPAADARELAGEDDEIAVWAIEVEGRVVGIIQASEETEPHYRHAGIDIVLESSAQGRGLGSDAVRTVARWLIRERGHHRLTIDPAADNGAAIAALRDLVEREGIFGGPSCGAVLVAAAREAQRMTSGTIVALLPDGGWKYLSAGTFTRDLDEMEADLEGGVSWW